MVWSPCFSTGMFAFPNSLSHATSAAFAQARLRLSSVQLRSAQVGSGLTLFTSISLEIINFWRGAWNSLTSAGQGSQIYHYFTITPIVTGDTLFSSPCAFYLRAAYSKNGRLPLAFSSSLLFPFYLSDPSLITLLRFLFSFPLQICYEFDAQTSGFRWYFALGEINFPDFGMCQGVVLPPRYWGLDVCCEEKCDHFNCTTSCHSSPE